MTKTLTQTSKSTTGAKTKKAVGLVVKSPVAKAAVEKKYFVYVFHANAMERISIVKQGIPAITVESIAKRMGVSKEKLFSTLGLVRSTVDRKASDNKALSTDESSRVLGMARLVGQVEAMVEESGNPKGFNAAEWVANWLERPLPALNGQRPAEFMDTSEGQALVAQLVARMQSGAHS